MYVNFPLAINRDQSASVSLYKDGTLLGSQPGNFSLSQTVPKAGGPLDLYEGIIASAGAYDVLISGSSQLLNVVEIMIWVDGRLFWKVADLTRDHYFVLAYSSTDVTTTVTATNGGIGSTDFQGFIGISGSGGSSSTRNVNMKSG